ncbi:MAG: PIN domain nuclease [Bacteroidetes bacterium QS_3_64_15]|nr:MAG: PIN domain nuclease [Bacteroidetes bacterium QS_3_64_15]
MDTSVLLDSVILIDHFNDIDKATDYLRSVRTDAVLSVVTRAEVLVGFESEKARSRGAALLNHFACLPITVEIADRAAVLRRNRGWKLPDAFQAALAKQHSLSLSTRNIRDFDADQHPFVVVPYTL